jgi:hypothetical protein
VSTFIALYRGDTVSEAKLVAVSADPGTVADFACRLLGEPAPPQAADNDPVLASIERGRRRALRLIAREARPEPVPAR